MRILILDDDRSYGALLASASKKLGHRAIIKVDAQEAVQILRNREADIALVDLEMPNGSGTAFAKTLRRNGINVPVAFCTGTCANLQLIEEAENMGQVLPKIWTHADLRVILSALQQESHSISRLRKAEAEIAEITENDPITPPLGRGSNPQAPVGFGYSRQNDTIAEPGEPPTMTPDTMLPNPFSPKGLPGEPSTLSIESMLPNPFSAEGLPGEPSTLAPASLPAEPSTLSIESMMPNPFSPEGLPGEPSTLSVDTMVPNPFLPDASSVPLPQTRPAARSHSALQRIPLPGPDIDDTDPIPPAKKRLETMLEVGDSREAPRVSIGCSSWDQVRRLCGDVMRGMTTITVRARCEMRAGEAVVVALELPDEMIVSIGARVLDFRDRSADGKRPYQLDLIGFGGDEITYLLACCDNNSSKSQLTDLPPEPAPSPLQARPGHRAPLPMAPSTPQPVLTPAAAHISAELEQLHPCSDDDFNESTKQATQPRIPDAIDAVETEPGQLDGKPSISWS